ncbi:transglutaminase-like domain-containing protein [Nocardioides rubriscoriae]|uniref:transglutaminase-like domain-containing protein n=1 Tax=Nocardioides rubriscoriae TaxID=642762 RepID=UPI0014787238|nr:transglutaminase-like domain-containing protein [Nocardioides rubriscoriae]
MFSRLLAGLTALPELPQPLADFAGLVGARAATPYQRALAIEALVRDEYTLSPTAISGSALWRLDQFLLGGPDQPGGGVGTSEQFASAFALLARYNGLPTRVVVGFRPGEQQPDGTRVVRGKDAFAWAEVYFRDLGWVPFSPTPDDDTFTRPRPIEATAPQLPEEAATGAPTPVPPPSATPDPEPDGPGGPDDAAGPVAADPWRGPAAPVLLGSLLGLAVVLLVSLRAGRRVRHLRRGAPGAWAEVVDAMHLSGLRPGRHQPADVVAADLDARLGTRAADLAARAELAAFGPSSGTVAGSGADLRPLLRDVRRRVRRETPLWRRWWWWLDPRVLRR